MRTKKKKKKGAPRRSIKEAREFGALVERETKPGDIQARVFERVRRLDPKRWGSTRKMYRLWAAYNKDKAKQPQRAATRRERMVAKMEERRPGYLRDFTRRVMGYVGNYYRALVDKRPPPPSN